MFDLENVSLPRRESNAAESGLRSRLVAPNQEPSNSRAEGDVEGDMTVNRIDKHDRQKGVVARHLRAMGLDVSEPVGANSFDLLVNDQIRVTLRVAYPGLRRHRVTVGGRSYRYRYETWHFNFHHHGRLDERYTDFFVCIAKEPKDDAEDRVYVIPWASVSGKTFSLHSGRSKYRGRYAPFRDAWDAIASAASQGDGMRRVA
jgi:hypothetical protein